MVIPTIWGQREVVILVSLIALYNNLILRYFKKCHESIDENLIIPMNRRPKIQKHYDFDQKGVIKLETVSEKKHANFSSGKQG